MLAPCNNKMLTGIPMLNVTSYAHLNAQFAMPKQCFLWDHSLKSTSRSFSRRLSLSGRVDILNLLPLAINNNPAATIARLNAIAGGTKIENLLSVKSAWVHVV